MNCDCQQNTLCSRGGHKLLQEETLRPKKFIISVIKYHFFYMYIFILYIFFRVSQFKEEKILKLKDYLQKYFHFFS
jgi:hypothetical protein